MALSVAVFVGETKKWIPELVEKAKSLKVGSGMDAKTDVGPLITKVRKGEQKGWWWVWWWWSVCVEGEG